MAVAMPVSVAEHLSEAMAQSPMLFSLLLLVSDLLDFEEVVVVFNFLLANRAQTELRTGGALVSDSHYGLHQASLALDSLVNQAVLVDLL